MRAAAKVASRAVLTAVKRAGNSADNLVFSKVEMMVAERAVQMAA